MNAEQLIDKYLSIRDKKAEMEKRHKAELEQFSKAMAKIEEVLMGLLSRAGGDSLKTAAGTAYIATVASAKVEDWEAALDWIKSTENWEMLERRASKTFVQAHVENTGELPPGVSLTTLRRLNIRRK